MHSFIAIDSQIKLKSFVAVVKRLLFIALIVLAGCNDKSGSGNTGTDRALFCTHQIPTDSTTLYFPSRSHEDSVGLDAFVNKCYSNQLFGLREPVLISDSCSSEIYRFTWLRTFDHPVSVRIEKSHDSVLIAWKECDGAGGYEPGQLIRDEDKSLSLNEWNTFTAMLRRCDFWNLPTEETRMQIDGAQWILEGKTNGKYHLVERNSPSTPDPFYECCEYLISLTDMKFTGAEKY